MNLKNKNMEKDELKKLEEEEIHEANTNVIPPSDIVAFNELRSCADLLRLYESKQMVIQPDFQREIVWNVVDQTRFIDSLTKQLPIPSMCISLDYKTNERLIVDGLQRMQTIINFLSNEAFTLANSKDVDERIAGKTVLTIKTDAKDIYARVQNVTIPITVIRCDTSKKEHNEYLFTIFHRLNSGGMRLNNQEIRNCIFNGNFNKFLKEIAQSESWKCIINFKKEKTYRFSNEEIFLRVFAFIDQLDSYNGKLTDFLNSYMDSNRNPSPDFIEEKRKIIIKTIDVIKDKILGEDWTPLSKTKLEGLLYGIATNIETVENKNVKELYEKFQNLPEFSVEELKGGLSAKDNVVKRLTAAKSCFK
jgi:hypothetical protein